MKSSTALERTDRPIAINRGLGWFSIALGITELAIPRLLARVIGIEPDRRSARVLRAMGVRELAEGISILFQPHRPGPLWGRVAGDVVDLAMLGVAARSRRTSGLRIAGAAAAVAGVTALDVIAGRRTQRAYAAANRPVLYAVTINLPRWEVYDFYRNFDQLPLFMNWLQRVDVIDDRRSHWVAKLPLGIATVEWDAEIVEDRPGEAITWRSTDDSRVQVAGRVLFGRAPGRDMTEVRIEMQLGFTGLPPSASLAKFFAKSQVKGDLTRLKQVLETGEVLRSDASVHAAPHPARPSGAPEATPVFIPDSQITEKGVRP